MNVDIATVNDVGAAKGAWTKKARRLWREAYAHLLEVKEEWRDDLAAFELKITNKFRIRWRDKTPGKAFFPKVRPSMAEPFFRMRMTGIIWRQYPPLQLIMKSKS